MSGGTWFKKLGWPEDKMGIRLGFSGHPAKEEILFRDNNMPNGYGYGRVAKKAIIYMNNGQVIFV